LLLQYGGYCDTVGTSTQFHATNLKQSMEQMSAAISSQVLHTGDSWPFVTVPGFEVIGNGARTQGGLETIVFSPLVAREQAERWASYSEQNLCRWVNESDATMILLHGRAKNDPDYADCNAPSTPFIFDFRVELGATSNASYVKSTLVQDDQYLPYWYVSKLAFKPTD
jgi:hypothetical protein